MHLLVDISAHGYGHLAQTAPVLQALRARLPKLWLTVRSTLPAQLLRQRIGGEFALLPEALDVGMVMRDATEVDAAAAAAAYREFHGDWSRRVALAAQRISDFRPDLVLANVPYLSLAAARAARVPALALCSLEWGALYRDLCAGSDPQGARIAAEIDAAYAGAGLFLCPQPSMPMPALANTVAIGPIAAAPDVPRDLLALRLGRAAYGRRIVLVGMGGIAYPLDPARWPAADDLLFVLPQAPEPRRPDMAGLDELGLSFERALVCADAVITKPGYGTFVEAACAGVAVGYLRRHRWLEQDALIDWLRAHARSFELDAASLQDGSFLGALRACLAAPAMPRVLASGAGQAAELIIERCH